jgi:hypothetical protein
MNANTQGRFRGLLFIAIAALFALGTLELDFGTARKLGPARFRCCWPARSALLGLVIVAQAFRNPGTQMVHSVARHPV